MNSIDIAILKQHDRLNTYVPHGDVTNADCVIGFSFGYIKTLRGVQPGVSNQQLAAYIEDNFPGKPLILQSEIDQALESREADLVISEARNPDEYLHSREIAEQALEYMNKHGWSSAVIVTHPAMEIRNNAICAKLGINVVAPAGLETIEYDLNSAQPWTRNQTAWWKREVDIIDSCIENGWL